MRRGKNHYLSNTFTYFGGKEKRTKRMTVLTLPKCHPLYRKKIILATMDCESENKANCTYSGELGMVPWESFKLG